MTLVYVKIVLLPLVSYVNASGYDKYEEEVMSTENGGNLSFNQNSVALFRNERDVWE